MLEGHFFADWDGALYSFAAELWGKGVTTQVAIKR